MATQCFFLHLDVAAENTFILHKLKFPIYYKNEINRERAYGSETLCNELLVPNIKARYEKFAGSNYLGFHSSLFAIQDTENVVLFVTRLFVLNTVFFISLSARKFEKNKKENKETSFLSYLQCNTN